MVRVHIHIRSAVKPNKPSSILTGFALTSPIFSGTAFGPDKSVTQADFSSGSFVQASSPLRLIRAQPPHSHFGGRCFVTLRRVIGVCIGTKIPGEIVVTVVKSKAKRTLLRPLYFLLLGLSQKKHRISILILIMQDDPSVLVPLLMTCHRLKVQLPTNFDYIHTHSTRSSRRHDLFQARCGSNFWAGVLYHS